MTQHKIDPQTIKFIAKNYNPLDYTEKLSKLLSNVYTDAKLAKCKKIKLHQLINEVIINQHYGEQSLKYSLFQTFCKKKVVAAFEVNVNKSRADFLTINGETSSFEIKSSLDNLQKLKKQALDYVKAFEYNYLVIDEKHLDTSNKLVPKSFGLWSFKNGKKKIHRTAALNKNIDPEIQLSLLNKKNLQIAFPEVDGNKIQILKTFNSSEINFRFKSALKNKYKDRWHFVVANSDMILPVDIQFFFKTTINPEHIYY